MLSVAASWLVIVSNHLWSGSTKTILFPSCTHFLAHSGFVPVYTSEDALPPAQPSSESHPRSEEHTSELQSLRHLVCRLLLEKKKKTKKTRKNKNMYNP